MKYQLGVVGRDNPGLLTLGMLSCFHSGSDTPAPEMISSSGPFIHPLILSTAPTSRPSQAGPCRGFSNFVSATTNFRCGAKEVIMFIEVQEM